MVSGRSFASPIPAEELHLGEGRLACHIRDLNFDSGDGTWAVKRKQSFRFVCEALAIRTYNRKSENDQGLGIVPLPSRVDFNMMGRESGGLGSARRPVKVDVFVFPRRVDDAISPLVCGRVVVRVCHVGHQRARGEQLPG